LPSFILWARLAQAKALVTVHLQALRHFRKYPLGDMLACRGEGGHRDGYLQVQAGNGQRQPGGPDDLIIPPDQGAVSAQG